MFPLSIITRSRALQTEPRHTWVRGYYHGAGHYTSSISILTSILSLLLLQLSFSAQYYYGLFFIKRKYYSFHKIHDEFNHFGELVDMHPKVRWRQLDNG